MRTRRALAAGTAVVLALAALFPMFNAGGWLWPAVGAIAVVTATGVLSRALRLPGLLVFLLQALALAGYLVVVFAKGSLESGMPTQATVDALRLLVEQGNKSINTYAPPVPPERGIVLITVAGVGLVALLVDLVAVAWDRAALAGLPLLALFAVPSAVLPGGLGSWPFAVGAAGWLLLLLEEGSDRIGRWGSPLRAPDSPLVADTGLARVGRRIGAAALGFALVVPPLVPGLDHRLFSGNGNGTGVGVEGDGPSTATTYNPITRLHDQLALPQPRQLLVYTTDDEDPDYLRMTTLDRWTGNGWMASELQADRKDARVQNGIDRPRGESPDIPHRRLTFRAAIDRDHLDVHWLPVPYGPTKVDVQGTWLWDDGSQTVFSASRTTKGLKPYSVTASRVLPDRAQLEASGTGVDGRIATEYGRPIQVSDGVRELTVRITRDAGSPYEKAVLIQKYFTSARNGFVYDLEATQPQRGQNALDAFLEGKHGFCEQYASAMAALLRVAGIPSRVAVGFTPGEPVGGSENTYRVTTEQAHAWPEAWFDRVGWVRFEPTPGASGATTPDYTVRPAQPGATPSASPSAQPRSTASAAPGRGFRDPDELLGQDGGAGAANGSSSRSRWLVPVLLAVLLTAVGPWVLTLLRRRRRAHDPDARRAPMLAWDQLRDDITDVGLAWRASESPRAVSARLGGGLSAPARDALARLAGTVELARFAPPGRARVAGLFADVALVRRGLLATAPRVVRLRAVVAPPSTLRWLAHLLSERVADVLDAVDRVLSVVGRPFAKVLRAREG
jgi:transglutaminase-like putative cysteine protease